MQFSDDSPQLRLLSVIILGVFLSLDATFGADPAITHDAPGSSSAITANQHQRITTTVVTADGSTRAARLAEDVLLLAVTTAFRLHRLFDSGDYEAGNCGKSAHDEPMFNIKRGRSQRKHALSLAPLGFT